LEEEEEEKEEERGRDSLAGGFDKI